MSIALNDRPKSRRIRFDDENWHRLEAIQGAANLYDRNKTDAVALGCDDMTRLAGVLQDFLTQDDLTRSQERELADALNHLLQGHLSK